MTDIDPEVLALAREREGYMRSGRPTHAIPVDEQLLIRGWVVNQNGELQPYAPKRERATARKAPERRPASED